MSKHYAMRDTLSRLIALIPHP